MTGSAIEDILPVYFFYGEEDYLIEEELKAIKSSVLTKGFESMNQSTFSGKFSTADEIIMEARTFPAFSGKRVIIVNDADKINAASRKEFLEYVKDPSPQTCLVFVAYTYKVEKKSEFFKLLKKKDAAKVFYRLFDNRLMGWVKLEAKRQGKVISRSAARKLLDIAGNGLRDIKNELDKIIIYAGDKNEVTVSDVEGVGIDVKEDTVFDLADCIGRKDTRAALKAFKKLSNEEPVKVMGAVIRQFRMILKVKALLREGAGTSEMPSLLGTFPRFAEGYVKMSKHFSENELYGVFGKLSDTDIRLKSSPVPKNLLISNLIVELCAGKNKRPA